MADGPSSREGGLFSQTRVCIIHSHELDKHFASQLSSSIEEHGGESVIHRSPAPLPPCNEFTHVISSTIDFPGHEALCDLLIPVVKPQWVQASIAKRKLANPRQYNPDPRLFLNDVVVNCCDIPEGDKDAIIGGVLAMGGLYTPRISSSTTHVVALSVDEEKCRATCAKLKNLKIVLPHWFDDCLKLGKRIDEGPYMLPHPEILQPYYDAPVKMTANPEIIGASTPQPKDLYSLNNAREDLNVFDGKTLMISEDLMIGERMLQCLETVITDGGGKTTYDVNRTDIYICRYREGDDYRTASRLGKDVGNLSWLYHLIVHNTWISPLRRLLHYPLSREGIPGFKDFKISLSNYAGEARIYLENLVQAAGGEATKTLKQENTHLITAHSNSEKCTAAREWNLHIVNHLWLEESYAKWQLKPVSDPRYTHFPQRTNLGEIVGQTRIDKFAIEEHFFPPEYNTTPEGIEPSTAMKQKDSNIPPTSSAVDTSTEEWKKSKFKKPTPVPKTNAPRSTKEPQSTTKDCASTQTPVMSRFHREGKENDTPSTTGSRKSKDLATARLHQIAPDISLYEKEKRRAGGVVYGGRRKSDDQVAVSRKRSVEPEETTDPDMKKQKKGRPATTMYLIITGYTPWVGESRREDSDRRRLRDLGIMVVQDASKCTHLAAPSILRTHKFVNALAYAPKILNCEFVTDCLKQEKLLDPAKYLLRDKKSEKKFNICLEKARNRAEKNKNTLLQGRTIFCVETIHGGFDVFKSIIETNGGQCALYRGRPLMISNRRSGNEDEGDNSKDEVYLISGTDKAHQKLWPKFRTMAENAKKTPRIMRSDWLLELAMAQEWRWKPELELKENDIKTDGDC
ncbi:regulator of Ty1 Transposition [Ophidiomyces ophidiicola]|uniref:regulator of Ty1 Transposition n=1 Tax=Ophidiomyces ophidiicola TaxID=1387563 RepID=UPI0020C2FF82|nr:regulator of Ty1 Transposition [Ophidiomyces ophidiicola]KAI1953768.1 regulator of Ty1 Transposition [Ophidiomyces ophidiicola]KAI2062847.1 regulator of Ty1 Transposition [Ophidiomyces ophidiicola]